MCWMKKRIRERLTNSSMSVRSTRLGLLTPEHFEQWPELRKILLDVGREEVYFLMLTTERFWNIKRTHTFWGRLKSLSPEKALGQDQRGLWSLEARRGGLWWSGESLIPPL